MLARFIPPKETVLNLSVLIVSTAVCLAIAEIFLRVLGYHGECFLWIVNTVIVDDPVLNWRHKPNSEFYFNNIVYRINKRGFRDHIYSYQKKPNTFRIFLASDSVSFGTNVQMKDSYPKILETKLNALNLPYHFQVINYSMPGLSLKQKFYLVELYADEYQPDLFVLDYIPNDIEFEIRKDSKKEKHMEGSIALINLPIPCTLESYLKQSALMFFLKQGAENILHALNWEDRNQFYRQVESDYYYRLYSARRNLQYLRSIFGQVRQYQERSSIQIVVPIFPVIYDYDKYKWEDINELIIGLCRENGLLFIPLLEDYRKFNYK